MGVSVTRIVKFIRKGEKGSGLITAVTNLRKYTLAQWKNYGAVGKQNNWTNISNAPDMNIGDTIVINGVVTDKENISISLYATIIAITGTTVIANSTTLIMAGERGIQGIQGLQGLQGPRGEQGLPGTGGKNGATSYFHIKYSAVANPTVSSQMSETPNTYIGTYVDFTKADSTDPKKYTWHRFEGLQGPKGERGIPGVGADGKTTYLHIKYSNNGGKTFTANNGETVGDYIGFCTDFNATDPTSVSSYTWSKIKGEPGKDGVKGDRGPALRGPQAWSDCAVGYMFQSGASGEEYKDVVLYGNNYYSCIKSHTKTGKETGANNTLSTNYWKLADKLEIVATKILLAQYALVKNLGVEAIDMKDANGNIIFQAKDGNVTCNSGTFTNGTFTNVKVIGSIRNPFNLANDSIDVDYSDNVAMLSSGGGWLDAYSMPWDVSQNGRRLTIVNYKWGGTMAQGQAEISAPNGKYFFEDGIRKSELKVSREIVEMIGYGTTTEFYGWIVLNRIDLMTSQKYGHCLKALAFGTVSGGNSSSNTSITSNTFDGSKLTVARQSEGLYRVFFPSTWFTYTSNCRVILTGRGVCYGASSPVKATMHSLGNGYFDVVVSDDATRNDGSFDFIIYNGSDFDILK